MSIETGSATHPETVQTETAEKVEEQQQSASAPQETDETAEESETSEQDSENDSESESGEDDESGEDESESSDEDKPKKKSGGYKKKIGKLTKQLSMQAEELAYWKEQALKGNKSAGDKVEELEASIEQTEAKLEAADPNAEPDPDNFKTHAEYTTALTKWALKQVELEKEQKAKAEAIKTEYQKTVQAHQERVQNFAKSHSDFDAVLDSVNDIPMSLPVQDVVLASEIGPALMYELAKNKEEYARICSLGEAAAYRELGKLESRLEAKLKASETPSEEKEEQEEVRRAPAPITPVGKKATMIVKKTIYDQGVSQRDYEAMRAKPRN